MITLNTTQPSRHSAPKVKAQKLAYLLFECPDLVLARKFLEDFGLCLVEQQGNTLYFRGTDQAPFCYRVTKADKHRFVGFGFTVANYNDLEILADLPGASTINKATYPGGGQKLSLTDPSGFHVEAITGQVAATPLSHRSALPLNYDQVQRVNDTQRPPIAPPEILRLGHVVIEVADFQDTCGWYTETFGLITSDVQVLPDGSPAVVFLRLDLGDTPADHHTLAIAQGFMPTYSHSAYEVVDADAVGMGQRVLRERGWKHAWGIGRHILGSQIFDYWSDPWGAKHEHYCDGDLFTHDQPMGIHPVSREAMSQWGQVMPASFTRPTFTPAALAALVSNLKNSPDLSIRKLIKLARLFA